jgi:hypothetical protein
MVYSSISPIVTESHVYLYFILNISMEWSRIRLNFHNILKGVGVCRCEYSVQTISTHQATAVFNYRNKKSCHLSYSADIWNINKRKILISSFLMIFLKYPGEPFPQSESDWILSYGVTDFYFWDKILIRAQIRKEDSPVESVSSSTNRIPIGFCRLAGYPWIYSPGRITFTFLWYSSPSVAITWYNLSYTISMV